MASGDVVGFVYAVVPPATTNATPDFIAGASTPAENIPVWDFDGSADEHLDFYGVMKGYAGGGITVEHKWSSSGSGNVVIDGAFRRVDDQGEDLDTDAHTYVYNPSATTAVPTQGEVDYLDVTFTDGADMDSVAVGELFRIKITRDGTNDSDNTDAELHAVEIKET